MERDRHGYVERYRHGHKERDKQTWLYGNSPTDVEIRKATQIQRKSKNWLRMK